jgi:hypothetical protein
MHGRRFPFAICMVFTLLGVLLIVVGSGEARVTGATSVLFFGVGSLALALPLATRRGAGTVELADVGSERGILLPAARAKQLMIIAACAGIAAACALLWAMTPDAAWIGIGGLVFFGGLGLWRLALLPRRHGLALTPTRLKLLGWGEPELDWDDISDAFLFEQSRNVMLGVRATDPARVRRRRSGRLLPRLNRRLTHSDIAVPAGQLAGPPEHALKTVLTDLGDPARRARLGTTEEFNYLLRSDGDGLR